MAHAPHKYLHAFIAEATEQLEQLASELVRIEQEVPGGALWDSIFRRVHSVKGSAATIGLSGIVAIAHAAETLIGKLKAQQARPERTHVDLLLQATDELVQEVQQASGTAQAPRADEGAPAALAAKLAEASRVLPDAPSAPPTPRSAGQKPVADPGTPRLDVSFSLSKACQAPGARSLIVQRKLKGLGVLLEMDPQPAALMQKKGGVRVTALLATARSPEEVRAAFDGIPEVEEVEVSAAPAANAPAPAPKAAEEGGAVRVVPDVSPAEETRTDATVRVRAQSLDQLLDQAAEVLHGIARLREAVRHLPENAATQFEAEIDRLRRTARDLHGRVMNARLTPFSSLTERLPRAIRDLAHRLGKEVELEVQGGAVELDRTVIEALADPLTHLVRNAVDHGLETSAQRISMGKSVRGLLVLSARRERDKVLVEVSDDGAGFDGERLRQRAIDMGALSPDKLPDVTEQQSYELAFLPGLSTREQATELSGRGVGLDAVKSAVERLGGKIGLRSAPGKGSRFTLELPLSVSMANLLLVQVGGELYGLPMTRIVATTEYDLSARGGEGFEARSLAVMGQLVRAYSLAKLFGLPSLAPPGPRPFAVLEVDGITFALSVDRLVGQEEAVLKPLFPPIDRIKGLAGTTVLGNGRPLLVLDPRGLHELAEASQRLRGAA
jgi:two-component system, chemotaxis family, sensor kinase CheA